MFFVGAASQSEVYTLQVIQPPDYGAVCPGEDLVLTCSISSMSAPPALYWQQTDSALISYYNGTPLSANFGDFTTTAHFGIDNYSIVSNATLRGSVFSHDGVSVSCFSINSVDIIVIMIAGTTGLNILIYFMSSIRCWKCSFSNYYHHYIEYFCIIDMAPS